MRSGVIKIIGGFGFGCDKVGLNRPVNQPAINILPRLVEDLIEVLTNGSVA